MTRVLSKEADTGGLDGDASAPAPVSVRVPRRKVPAPVRSLLWTTAVVCLLIAAIQVTSMFTEPYIFPDVPTIVAAIREILAEDVSGLLATIGRFFLALFAAMIVGWALGLLMGTFRNSVGELLRPVFSIMQAVPALSWVLISVIWVYSIEMRILLIVFVIGVPFFVIAVYEGIRSTDHDMVEAVNQFRPSRWQVLVYLFLPQSLSYVLLTLKSASSFCLRILVFAELIGATTGIGYEMGQAQANFRVDLIFGWTVLLIVFNFALAGAVNLAERYLLRWRREAVVR